VKLVGRT